MTNSSASILGCCFWGLDVSVSGWHHHWWT